MSAKSLLRTGVASPSRALRTPSSPRGILKRPPPLPLSQNPFPFAASVTVVVSPGLKSPHVHFPPSATLTCTFSTHSPNSYDRGAISVSPNPLEMPAWGARIYSPSSDSFVSAKESPGEVTPTSKDSTPPSIVLSPAANVDIFPNSPGAIEMKPTTRAGLRFQAIASQSSIRPVNDLGKALKMYPRSPYPSAPSSPLARADKENAEEEKELAGGRAPMRRKTVYGANPTRVSRGSPLEGSGKRKVPPPLPIRGRDPVGTHVSSPYPQEFLSPVVESPQRTITPTNSKSSDESLTQAFWQSMSLDESEMTSPVGLPTEAEPASPGLFSPMVFATKDGVLSSMNDQSGLVNTPTVGNFASMRKNPRSLVMSPSPDDPFSAFPSFSAVLSLEGGAESGSVITYPPRAVISEESAV